MNKPCNALCLGIVLLVIAGLLSCANDENNESGDFDFELYPVQVNNKFGYVNPEGRLVIEPIYEHASIFVDGLAMVISDKGWELLDENGVSILGPFDIDGTVAPINNGVYWIEEAEGGGYCWSIDGEDYSFLTEIQGLESLAHRPIHVGLATDGDIFIARIHGKWSAIDSKGKLLFPPT